MSNIFCPICGSPNIEIGKASATLETDSEVLLEYEVKTCGCRDCGCPAYSKEVDDFNRAAYGEAIRKVVPGKLSLTEIRGLPRIYDIPRKEFRIVMGIPTQRVKENGETEDFKIFNGDLPNYKEEERLRAVKEDPKKWIEFLKLSENKIDKKVFKKSMEAAKARVK